MNEQGAQVANVCSLFVHNIECDEKEIRFFSRLLVSIRIIYNKYILCTWSLSGARSASFVVPYLLNHYCSIFAFCFAGCFFILLLKTWVARSSIPTVSFILIFCSIKIICLHLCFLLLILVTYFSGLQLFSTVLIYMLNMYSVFLFKKKIVNICCLCFLYSLSVVRCSKILHTLRKK